MKYQKRLSYIISLLLSTLLSACSSVDSINYERYTLTQDIMPQSYDFPFKVEVSIPTILAQGGVVLELDDVTLRPASNYRYSANLDEELALLMQNTLLSYVPISDEIAQKSLKTQISLKDKHSTSSKDVQVKSLPSSHIISAKLAKGWPKEYKIEVYISQFQGTLDGHAKVKCFFKVVNTKNKQQLFAKEYFKETSIAQDGYSALVQSLKQNYIDIINNFLVDFVNNN